LRGVSFERAITRKGAFVIEVKAWMAAFAAMTWGIGLDGGPVSVVARFLDCFVASLLAMTFKRGG
jgi:hypothetical protein